MPGIAPKLSDTPGGVRWQGPTLGEHTDEVLADLGKTAPEIFGPQAPGNQFNEQNARDPSN